MARIINCTKIKSSKNWENKILKLIPKTDEDIFIKCVGMKRNNGRGSYLNYLDLDIGNDSFTFSFAHNDSVGWDEYQDWDENDRVYQNWAKALVLNLIEGDL